LKLRVATAPKAIRCLVSGRVQGVNYRSATLSRAEELAVHGWVRNLPDGRVEVVAAGDPQAVGVLASWLWQGPPAARVEAVRIEEWAERVEAGFAIAR
jgi:acylphosphatase